MNGTIRHAYVERTHGSLNTEGKAQIEITFSIDTYVYKYKAIVQLDKIVPEAEYINKLNKVYHVIDERGRHLEILDGILCGTTLMATTEQD